MFNILTLNKISKVGLANLDSERFACADDVQKPDAIIVRSASMHEMQFPDNLLAVARAGAGVNNIPVDRCTENGICVFNTPGANANAVKELVICALLLSSRKILAGSRWCDTLRGSGGEVPKMVEKGKSSFKGPEILGKTLGVVGLGAIGAKVAEAACALGMKVLCYDPFVTKDSAERFGKSITLVGELDSLIADSDYITLHVPANDKTRGMINAANLCKARDGVRILNFARGELVNTDDILEALKSGKCAAYATDFPNEALLGEDNVVAIPHLGASTPEAEDNCAIMAARQLSDYLLSGCVVNSVNFPAVTLEKSARSRLTAVSDGDRTREIENALAELNITLRGKACGLKKNVGYAIFDTDCEITDECIARIKAIDGVTAVRVI